MPLKLTLVSLALLLSLSSQAKTVVINKEDSTKATQTPDTLKGKLVCTFPIKYFPEAFDIKNDTLYFIKHNSKKIQRYTLNGKKLTSRKRHGREWVCFLNVLDDGSFLYGMYGVHCFVGENRLFHKPLRNFFQQSDRNGKIIFKSNDTFMFFPTLMDASNFLFSDYGYRLFDRNKTMNGNIDFQYIFQNKYYYSYACRTRGALHGKHDSLVITNGEVFIQYETNGRLLNSFKLNDSLIYTIEIRANKSKVELIYLDTMHQNYLSKYYLIDSKSGAILKRKIMAIDGISFENYDFDFIARQFAPWRKNHKLYLLLYQKSKNIQVYEFDTEK